MTRQITIRNQWIQCWSSAILVAAAVRFNWPTFGPPGMSTTAEAIDANPDSAAATAHCCSFLLIMLSPT